AACREATGGRGVDVVLDSIGAAYRAPNLASLAVGGRLVLIGLMGGAKAEIGLGALLARRLQLIGSTLRTRSAEEKACIAAGFAARFGPALARGEIRPIVDRVLPPERAADAHRAMKASEHFRKIVLRLASANARRRGAGRRGSSARCALRSGGARARWDGRPPAGSCSRARAGRPRRRPRARRRSARRRAAPRSRARPRASRRAPGRRRRAPRR